MESRPPVVVGPLNQPPEQPPRPSFVVPVAVGLAAGLIGILIGVTVGDGGSDLADVISAPSSSSTTVTSSNPSTSSTSAAPSTITTLGITTTSPPEYEMEPLAGAGFLEGHVALAPFPHDGGSNTSNTLWVFRPGGSVVRRDNVPFSPGDFQHPMLFTGGRIVFSDGGDSWLLNADLVESPVRLGEAGFVVPGAVPGLVWLVDPQIPIEWVAPLDVETQTVGERFEVTDVIQWPLAGIADGLVVIPVDAETYGTTAYWSPTEALEPIEGLITPSQSGVFSGAGNTAVVVSPGTIRILDFSTGEVVASFPIELGEGLVSEVCLSPNQQYVAIVGSTGEAFVADTRSGAVLQRLSGVHSNSIGWTSSEQFVYIADANDATWIEAQDVSTRNSADVARLSGSQGWWLSASAAMC